MQGDRAAGPHEAHHLVHQLLRFGHVHEHEARRGQIEGLCGQTRLPGIGMEHLDVRDVLLGDELLRPRHLVRAAFDPNDVAGGPDPLGQEPQTALRAAAQLNDAPSGPHPNLIKQPAGIVRQLVRLALQPCLLRRPIP